MQFCNPASSIRIFLRIPLQTSSEKGTAKFFTKKVMAHMRHHYNFLSNLF